MEPCLSYPWTGVKVAELYEVKEVRVKVGGTDVLVVIGLNLYFVLEVSKSLTHLKENVDW